MPIYICGRPIGGRHRATQQPQVKAELVAVMSSVENATPENPDAFALHIEERYDLQPPLIGLGSEERKPGEDKFD